VARRGFLSRIREFFRGHREQPPAPPPSVPTGIDYPRGDIWREAWIDADIPRKYGSYRSHRNLFLNYEYGLNIDDPNMQFEDWEMYLKYIVKGESEFRRNDFRNEFWQFTGTAPEDFDWDDWRSAMGYSRTGER
jgi:hypothetical protein